MRERTAVYLEKTQTEGKSPLMRTHIEEEMIITIEGGGPMR